MRSLIISMLAVIIMAVAIIPTIDGAEAEGPAEIYFFDADNVCIGQVYLIPGEPIKDTDIPWHGSYKEWYDEDARRICAGLTFEAGPHTVKAYDVDNPPTPPEPSKSGPPWDIIILLIILGAAVAVIVVTLFRYMRR